MRCEIVAVGTELLLGQIVDTNSSWMGERLALIGVEHQRQTKVGDNLGRIVDAITEALERADAVIVCGGLGPTQDDITREAIAQVMGVELVRDDEVADVIRELFASRGRTMPDNNLRQADVPGRRHRDRAAHRHRAGADLPGGRQGRLRRPRRALRDEGDAGAGRAARPGGPGRRAAGDRQPGAAHVGRERVAGRRAARPAPAGARRDRAPPRSRSSPAASRASRCASPRAATARSTPRRCSTPRRPRCERRSATSCSAARTCRWRPRWAASSRSGAGRWPSPSRSPVGWRRRGSVNVPGSSEWFKGGVVAYDSQVKFDVLDVPEGPVVSEDAAKAMADGVRRLLKADVGIATTGVAGPAEQEGQPPGTVWLGVAVGDDVEARLLRLPGDRDRVRQLSVISLMDLLRRKLLAARLITPRSSSRTRSRRARCRCSDVSIEIFHTRR